MKSTQKVTTAIGSFLKRFGDAVLPYVESLMPHIAPMLDKVWTWCGCEVRVYVVCVCV